MNAGDQLEILLRGCVDVHDQDDLLRRLETGKPLKIKAGFDPTRPDLHLGHTVLMQKMRQFQELGHEVQFLIGDFTAMVGDPTGRNDLRPRLTRPEVLAAAATYTEQAFKILDRDATTVVYNSEWLDKMPLSEMIELAAKRTVARTLERRDFMERFESHRDIYIHELLYPLLQGYDSVALESDVELGGTDQLFNLMVGRDFMTRYGKTPQIVMTVPILEGIDAKMVDSVVVGKKMSKSADNYVGLNDAPVEMYRKCMQIGDDIIWRFFDLLSDKSASELSTLKKESRPLQAKASFANEMVTRFHDAEAAAAAKKTFDSTYMVTGIPDDVPEIDVPTEGEHLLLAKALAAAKLASSGSEGRRLITQGGVSVNEERVRDRQHQLDRGSRYLVRVGSKKRRFAYIRVT